MNLERPLKTRMELRIICAKIEALYGVKIRKDFENKSKSNSIVSNARKVYFAAAMALTTYSQRQILNYIGVKSQAKTYYEKCISKPDLGFKMELNKGFEHLGVESRLSYEKEFKEGQQAIKQVEYLTELIRHIDDSAGIDFIDRYDEVKRVL